MEMSEHKYQLLQNETSETETTTTCANTINKTLIWVDEEANDSTSSNYQIIIDMFKKIPGINYKFYNSVDLFITEIRSMSKTTELLVTMSGTFAINTIPNLSIGLLREISSIFIFCNNNNNDNYKNLFKKYRKIKYICTDEDSLKKAIEDELHPPTDFVIMDENLKPIFNLQENYSEFAWYKTYIDVIKNCPYPNNNREKMIDECKKYYRTDIEQMKKIDQFRYNYNSETAIQWYTRNSFLYRLVNKALRSVDMERILLFQFYIRDLCKGLEKLYKENQSNKSLTLYRGHGNMSQRHFDQLRKNVGALISLNGFSSTSTNFNVALMFAGSGLKVDVSVVYEIKANYALKKVAFADVSRISDMADEEEVLFSLCAVFRIDDIVRDEENQLWKVVLSATDEDTPNLPGYTNRTTTENQPTNVRIIDRINSRVKQSCRQRPIIIAFATVFIIAVAMLVVIFELYGKSKYKISNSYNCENGNCTTSTTTISINKTIKPTIATVTGHYEVACTKSKWNSTGVTVAGGNGEGPSANQLYLPYSVAVTSSGDIYVGDSLNHRIQLWKVGQTEGITVWPPDDLNTELYRLGIVHGLCLDPTEKELYIIDEINHRALKWTVGTDQIAIIVGEKGVGSALDQLSQAPKGLTVDRLSNVYISDSGNCRVVKWTPGADRGEIVAGGNGDGDEANQLSGHMHGIAVDKEFTIFVADTGNRRIQMWPSGASSGTTIASTVNWIYPLSLTLDSKGNIYVGSSSAIIKWNVATKTAITILSGSGRGAKQVSLLYDLKLTPDDVYLFAVDANNNRVLRYSSMKTCKCKFYI